MMRAAEAGGLSVVKNSSRDKLAQSRVVGTYHVNPDDALYEPQTEDMRDPDWPRQHDGKALKVVMPWLHHLAVHEYRVCFLRRGTEEIRQSYEAAFGQRLIAAQLEQAIIEAIKQLRNRRDVRSLSVVWYRDLIADPMPYLRELDWPIDAEKAAATFRPELCRFRQELLTVGI